ncbi:hypothetical protein [Caballeronia sp. 15715]|uniref:hypothetical protein n=1 Tax=unclassified Caballeronia TaxID=2646786 RepID=UPI0039E4CC3F
MMLFSDNVSLAHERAIKTLAREKNLLVKVLTFVAWIFGSLVGFMTVKGVFSFTSIPSLDSIIVACACYAIFSRVTRLRGVARL